MVRRWIAFHGLAGLMLAYVLATQAQAREQWDFQFMLTPRGVHFPEVDAIVEDEEGRIWAASWGGGVARLDGPDWRAYTEADGLGSDWVRTAVVGEDGTVWIGTPSGLCHIQGDEMRSIHRSAIPALAADEPYLLHNARDGSLILATYEGAVLRIRGASRQASLVWESPDHWEVLLAKEDSGGYRAYGFHDTMDGRTIVTFGDNTWAEIEGGTIVDREPAPIGTLYFTNDTDGQIWAAAAGSGNIYRLDGDRLELIHTVPEAARGLRLGPDGWCYLQTRGGLFRFTASTVEPVDLGPQVGFPDINSIHFATDGSLWLGTREGLVRGAPETWKHYPATREGHPIIAIVRDPANTGQLLAVDENSCLATLVDDSWRETLRLAAPETLGNFETWPGEPSVWAMGVHTLYRFDASSGALLESWQMPETGLDRRLFRTSAGELWLAATDGVHALVDGEWQPRPVREGYQRRTVNAFCEPEPGVFFVGVRDGIERWAGGEITYYGRDAGVAEDDAVYTICHSSTGDLWFGTYGSGVYRYKGGTFQRFGESEGLAHHSISRILETRDGTVWLAYRRVGIASYRDNRWLNFGYENGLTNAPIRQLLEDASGRLWLLAEDKGVLQYRPDTGAPRTEITAATETVPYGGVGVFSYRGIDAWQRTPTHALLYATRVVPEGGEAPWGEFRPDTSHIAEGLPPGRYRFEVRASDDARNVDPLVASVDFSIAVPLWREPRVLALAGVLLALASAALLLRMRAHRALKISQNALLESNGQLMSEIRERIQAERRLNEHFEQLEVLVRARTSELETAQRALVEQERLATLGKVTASVSHELRNPLGTLRSSLFLIGRKTQGLNLGLEDALARGERSIQRCDRIIEEFLDFTRTVEMEWESLDLDMWVRELVEELSLPENVRCEFNAWGAGRAEVDPERLRRAVVNVVNNAVQAMQEQGGGTLRVSTRRAAGRIEIVVQDTGPGIPRENLARIFEPLFSTKGFGIGLGVPIVRDVMRKHGGDLSYSSVPGAGTTAILWLPCGAPSGRGEILQGNPDERAHEEERDDKANDKEDDPEGVQ